MYSCYLFLISSASVRSKLLKIKKKPRGFETPCIYLDVSKVESVVPGGWGERLPMASAYRIGRRMQLAAGGTWLTSTTSCWERGPRGRGGGQKKMFPLSPSRRPFHIPWSQSWSVYSYLHVDKSISPTFIHFSILKKCPDCSEIAKVRDEKKNGLYRAHLCMKCSLGISNFLEEISSLSHSVVFLYFFALIAEEVFLISPCYGKTIALTRWTFVWSPPNKTCHCFHFSPSTCH